MNEHGKQDGLHLPTLSTLAGQALDPVCGMRLDPAKSEHRHEHGGTTYHFCCNKCPVQFKTDPDSYFARFAAKGVQLESVQTTCPVSGDKLEGVEIGEPPDNGQQGSNNQVLLQHVPAQVPEGPCQVFREAPRRAAGRELIVSP